METLEEKIIKFGGYCATFEDFEPRVKRIKTLFEKLYNKSMIEEKYLELASQLCSTTQKLSDSVHKVYDILDRSQKMIDPSSYIIIQDFGEENIPSNIEDALEIIERCEGEIKKIEPLYGRDLMALGSPSTDDFPDSDDINPNLLN